MKHLFLFVLLSFITPLLTSAQALPATSGGRQTLPGFIGNFVLFLNGTIVPFMLGIAFVIFVINVVRFFVLKSTTEDGQKAAKALALYSVLAFVIIIIFWGVVNLLTSSLGLRTTTPPASDYSNLDRPVQTAPAANPQPPAATGFTPPPSGCTTNQTNFDNEFGGPCATTPPPPQDFTQPTESITVECILPNGNIISTSLGACRNSSGVINN